MGKDKFQEMVEIPEGVQVSESNGMVTVKGSKGEASKLLKHPSVSIKTEGNNIVLTAQRGTKREQKIMYSMISHLGNLIKGAQEGFIYKLKICSGHFPMNVSVKNNVFEIKNFLGEAVPRKFIIKEGATVKVEGNEVSVEGTSKEITGQVAADIEKLTTIKGRDKRIFQDGIYITSKDGKEM